MHENALAKFKDWLKEICGDVLCTVVESKKGVHWLVIERHCIQLPSDAENFTPSFYGTISRSVAQEKERLPRVIVESGMNGNRMNVWMSGDLHTLQFAYQPNPIEKFLGITLEDKIDRTILRLQKVSAQERKRNHDAVVMERLYE